MQIIKVKLLFLMLMIASCVHNNKDDKSLFSLNCEVNETCEVSGNLTVLVSSNSGAIPASSIGILKVDENCIALALPEKVFKNKRTWDGKAVYVVGQGYTQYAFDNETFSYELEDRTVMANLCETGVIVYVTKIKKI